MQSSDSKSKVWEVIKKALREELGENVADPQVDHQIKTMKKTKIMDIYVDSFEKKITTTEIYNVVNTIFDFDLNSTPVLLEKAGDAKQVINHYLNLFEKKVTGEEIRKIMNQIFGINLDAISALSGEKISLYSKNQWVVRHEHDLFVVYTGIGDIDIKVFPTRYFMEQTGLTALPADLQHSLKKLGFYFDEQIGSFYYRNPSGEPVPDSFKGQTMGAIMEVIHRAYPYL